MNLPYVPEATRREFEAGSEPKLWMTGKLRVGCAVIEEMFWWKGSLQCAKQILSCDAMTFEKCMRQ